MGKTAMAAPCWISVVDFLLAATNIMVVNQVSKWNLMAEWKLRPDMAEIANKHDTPIQNE